MNFGKWIVVAFVIFGVFIASLVTVCMKQDIDLVATDYYQQELKHQQKITLVQNANELKSVPVISIKGSVITITFSDFSKLQKGELKVLRPSDPKLDRNFQIQPTAEVEQHFPLTVWEKGLYRASMQWTMEGKDYYIEKLIVL